MSTTEDNKLQETEMRVHEGASHGIFATHIESLSADLMVFVGGQI